MTERMTMENELARIRAEVSRKRPAEAFPTKGARMAAPQHAVRAVNVRPVTRPAAPARPGRLELFHAWRREHYVADQALRVVAILAGAAGALGLACALIVLAFTALFSAVSSAALAGGAAVLLLLLGLGISLGRPSGAKGYGFHWSKCDH